MTTSSLRPYPTQLSKRELARFITGIENGEPNALGKVHEMYSQTGRAHTIGVTGAPGSGKSTLVAAVAKVARSRGKTVAIISVDPSSPFTGGAILGDRIRMRELFEDEGVFIRSMANRGMLGGIAGATADVAIALDAAGFDLIFIETVGAGQAEVEVARVADTVIVVEAPGLGDDVQAIKAGILEIADVLVVNKADRDGAERAVSVLQAALDLGPVSSGHHGPTQLRPDSATTNVDNAASNAIEWRIPIIKTIATQGVGIEDVLNAIERHAAFVEQDAHAPRRTRRAEQEVLARLRDALLKRALQQMPSGQYRNLIEACAARQLHPEDAAQMIANATVAHSSTDPSAD